MKALPPSASKSSATNSSVPALSSTSAGAPTLPSSRSLTAMTKTSSRSHSPLQDQSLSNPATPRGSLSSTSFSNPSSPVRPDRKSAPKSVWKVRESPASGEAAAGNSSTAPWVTTTLSESVSLKSTVSASGWRTSEVLMTPPTSSSSLSQESAPPRKFSGVRERSGPMANKPTEKSEPRSAEISRAATPMSGKRSMTPPADVEPQSSRLSQQAMPFVPALHMMPPKPMHGDVGPMRMPARMQLPQEMMFQQMPPFGVHPRAMHPGQPMFYGPMFSGEQPVEYSLPPHMQGKPRVQDEYDGEDFHPAHLIGLDIDGDEQQVHAPMHRMPPEPFKPMPGFPHPRMAPHMQFGQGVRPPFPPGLGPPPGVAPERMFPGSVSPVPPSSTSSSRPESPSKGFGPPEQQYPPRPKAVSLFWNLDDVWQNNSAGGGWASNSHASSPAWPSPTGDSSMPPNSAHPSWPGGGGVAGPADMTVGNQSGNSGAVGSAVTDRQATPTPADSAPLISPFTFGTNLVGDGLWGGSGAGNKGASDGGGAKPLFGSNIWGSNIGSGSQSGW